MHAKIRWTTWTRLLLASPALAGVWGARDQCLSRLSSGVDLDPEMLDRFGEALALADLDGDGRADVAIGVPGAVINGSSGTRTRSSCSPAGQRRRRPLITSRCTAVDRFHIGPSFARRRVRSNRNGTDRPPRSKGVSRRRLR